VTASRDVHAFRLSRWLPLVPVVAGVVLFIVLVRRDADVDEPLEIRSDAPVYQSLGALVAASDLIVIADVTAEAPGRVISAPADPDAAFGTRLVTLRVTEALKGEPDGALTLEEIATTAESTPVIVDGQPPTQVGERVLLFLVVGDDFAALVNGQGRYVLSPADQVIGPPSLLPLDWTVDELRQLAAACQQANAC
jgi:hypothetical protein